MDIQREFDFSNHMCLICGKMCNGRRSLGTHLGRTHRTTIKDYTIIHLIEGKIPSCECGCGVPVEWHETLFRFNRFINGHNHKFSTTNQPNFTPEQITNRNDAIRQAYIERGPEINARISESVLKTYKSDPTISQRLSQNMLDHWEDPEWRAAQTLIRQKTWDEQHDELCKKIFTQEFRKKISEANMRRGMVHTSKQEQEFIFRLKNVFSEMNIVDPKWVNNERRTMCVDLWIKELDAHVEFDGVYYHGLDRESGFDKTQFITMTNDVEKDDVAIEERLTYIRIASDIDMSKLRPTIQSLIDISYFALLKGKIVKNRKFNINERVNAFKNNLNNS